MPDNYREAALRHYDDANTLAAAKSLDNAGHLMGFAAECALKHKLRELHNDPAATFEGHHLNPLRQIRTFLNKRRMTGPWLAFCARQDYLAGWDVGLRYAKNGTVTEAIYTKWKDQSETALKLAYIFKQIPRPNLDVESEAL